MLPSCHLDMCIHHIWLGLPGSLSRVTEVGVILRFPVSSYQLPRRVEMVEVIFFIGLFVLTGIIIVTDNQEWNRKK
jgi:hypothetical protein